MKRIFRKLICVVAARPVRRIPYCGPIRNTCVCFARVMTGRCSTRFQKSSRGIAMVRRTAKWSSGSQSIQFHKPRRSKHSRLRA